MKEVEVMAWFNKAGKMMPIMVRYEEASQELITVKNIKAVIIEDTTPTIIYACTAVCDEYIKTFKLVFFNRDHSWRIDFGQ